MKYLITVGPISVIMASKSRYSLPDLFSISTHISHHHQIQSYDRKGISRTNWFDLAGTTCLDFGPKPLNAVERIKAVLNATLDEEPLEIYFSEQSNIRWPCNCYATDSAGEGGGLDNTRLQFREHTPGFLQSQRTMRL